MYADMPLVFVFGDTIHSVYLYVGYQHMYLHTRSWNPSVLRNWTFLLNHKVHMYEKDVDNK